MRFLHTARCAAALGSAIALVHAQPAPGPSIDPRIDAGQQQLQQQQQRAQHQRLMPDARVRDTPAAAPGEAPYPSDESPCFTIHRLRWQGLPEGWAWLARQLDRGPASPIGRCLGAGGVAVAVQHAQAQLVARGHVTSRVLVEPQDLSTGTLALRVLVGRLGRVRLHPSSDAGAHLGNALALREGEPLNLREVEQILENLQRLPTVTADIEIVPADGGNMTSDLVVRWRQASPWRLSLALDDAGSGATGRYQGAITLSRDHALGRNDLLYLTLQHGLGGAPGSTRGATLHYSLPLGRHMLAFTASAHQYEQAVAGAFQRYVYAGKGETQELSLTRLLHRDAASTTRAQFGIGTRASRNFIDDTEVAVQRRQTSHWSLALLHDAQLGANELKSSLTHRQGMRALGAHEAPEAAFNEGTAFARWWLAEAHWQRPLDSLPGRWRLSSGLRTQWHDTRLTAPDRFAIGSRYTVRGFGSEALLSGDSGWAWRHELSATVMNGPLQAYLGLDRGCVSGPAAQVLPGRCLTGAALGLRGTQGPWSADVFLAWPLRHPSTLRPAHATAGFQLFAQF